MSAFEDFNAQTGCLSLNGELTIYEASAAFGNLCKAFGSGKLRQVDLAGVTALDTAGLQILLLARSLRATPDQPVALVNHSDAVQEVLGLTELESEQ